MSKKTIKLGKKYSFVVELRLSEGQLELLCQHGGGHGLEPYREVYLEKVDGHVIQVDPNSELGLGADLNDVLSLGFLVLAKSMNQTIEYENLFFHPYSNRLPVIEELRLSHVDCEIESEFTPITEATLLPEEDQGEESEDSSGSDWVSQSGFRILVASHTESGV